MSSAPMPAGDPAALLDVIELRGLRVLATVGVLPEEQVRAQPVEIDLDVHTDLTAAGRSDDLDDTVDYGALADEVVRVATSGHVALLEHLATTVADTVLADQRVVAVTVAARKLRPPVPHDLASSGVRLTRRQP
ncbi:MAG: dihydroneopterin aldolase [Acidimicrobiia bacterium]|nr:dihydroneopterin aldolase [Acidimicrobiia bacterium]MCC5954360.1 dihydroneopterin aldolase [Acidimicrobiia bacterium]